MGDHDDGGAEAVDGVPEQAEDLGGGARVERAGGLVREDHVRAGDQGAGDGDALLLAAGELAGPAAPLVAESHLREHLGGAPSVGALPREAHREDYVLLDGQRREQVERLEHEAEAAAAQLGQSVLVHAGDLGAAEPYGTLGRAVEPGRALEEGRLARARGAHHGGEAAAREGEVE